MNKCTGYTDSIYREKDYLLWVWHRCGISQHNDIAMIFMECLNYSLKFCNSLRKRKEYTWIHHPASTWHAMWPVLHRKWQKTPDIPQPYHCYIQTLMHDSIAEGSTETLYRNILQQCVAVWSPNTSDISIGSLLYVTALLWMNTCLWNLYFKIQTIIYHSIWILVQTG
jgi:hypothetical protein